ncbi:MAG: hypothetical protein WAT71_04095 [Ignavibacteria bacterium]
MKNSLKLLSVILLVLLSIFSTQNSYSANEYFRSIASGNWNSNATWEMSLNNSTWVPATLTPSEVSNLITIRANNVVTVTVNVTADQLTINDSAVLVINNGVILSLFNGGGNDLTMFSGSILNGPGTVRTLGIANDINLRAGSAFNAALNVNAGITYVFDQSSPYTGNIYGDVTVDAGATLNGGTSLGRNLSLYGNVINNGILTVSSTGAFMRINGPSLTNSGTINHAGTLYFDSSTALSGAGTFTPSGSQVSGNITLGSNITYSPTSYITILPGGILNPNSNIFTITSGSMYLDDNSTISSPGTVRTQISASIYLAQLAAFNAALHVNTGDALATGLNSPWEGKIFGDVTIDSGTTLNGGNVSGRDLYIYGNVINNGRLFTSSTGGTLRIKGPSLTNNGVINPIGRIFYDTTTTLSGAGTFTPAISSITGNGNITLGSNITYSPTDYIDLFSGAILNLNGNTFTLTSRDLYLNDNSTISASGTVRTQNSVNIYLAQLASFNAALNVNTGNTLATGLYSPWEGKIFGNVTLDAGTALNGGHISGRDLFLYGNVINNGTLFASSTGATLRINGPSLTNNGLINPSGTLFFDSTTSISGSGSFTSHANLTSTADITLNSNHQMRSVTVNTGAGFDVSNQHLKLTASNPIVQNGTFAAGNSKIEYNGTALQTVSTANINYHALTINNPAGAIMSGSITMSDTLNVILGDLNLNGNNITFTPDGYLKETPGNLVFGTTGFLITTRTLGAPSSLNVAGFGAVLTTSTSLGSTIIKRGHTVQNGLNGGTSIKRYYDITPTNNSGLNATLVYKYDPSELNGKPESLLQLFKSTNSGGTWLLQNGLLNYSAKQISITGLNSFSRWSADSTAASASITIIPQAFYNASSNRLNMSDTVRGYLRNTSPPYILVDSAIEILDYIALKVAYKFDQASTGFYYIQMKHRNSIETWSKFGVNFFDDNTMNYDFAFAANQAFGDNQTQVDASPLRFAIWSGDVNQDGFIDVTDGGLIDNDAANFTTGYVPTDVNGDDIVDVEDAVFADNNGLNFVGKITP